MKGRAFLDVLPLLSPTQTEPSIRTQIGRIYYGAYLEARQWCETNLGFERTRLGREHSQVQKLLAGIDGVILEDLIFLRTYRNTADYDLHVSVDTLKLQLADALERAENVIARLDNLRVPTADSADS
jgi:hypothetical protein